MSTEQKLDVLLQEVAELKALIVGKSQQKTKKQAKKESKEEIANRLLAKIGIAASAEKAS